MILLHFSQSGIFIGKTRTTCKCDIWTLNERSHQIIYSYQTMTGDFVTKMISIEIEEVKIYFDN